jgi:hypothetical protein
MIKPQLRLPLYFGLIVMGLLAILLKRDDSLGLVLGLLGIGVGAVAIYWWSTHRPAPETDDVEPSEQNPPEPPRA